MLNIIPGNTPIAIAIIKSLLPWDFVLEKLNICIGKIIPINDTREQSWANPKKLVDGISIKTIKMETCDMKTTFIQRLICGFIKGVISLRVANPKNRFAD